MASVSYGETVGLFYDSTVAQVAFAAGDVKAALQARSIGVESFGLAQLGAAYGNKKIVIATAADAMVATQLAAQGGNAVTGLGEQAYALRTTTQTQAGFWALGGDANGAMYGGLQLAENIRTDGLSGSYNTQESPYIKRRGIKFNIPLDARCPTYYGAGTAANTFPGTVMQDAIPHVWDFTFWSAWFDEMARHRYNVLSLWNLHPFPALLNMPEYPNVALQDVKGFNGFTKTMSIDEKIVFWKKVMAYGRDRGFEIYIIDWSIYTDGATGKYGIDNSPTNAATVTYMRKCMTQLLETYPDLTGFGVTSGENMGNLSSDGEEKWMWSTIGQGMYDYAKAHPERKVTFVHRYHQTGGPAVVSNFQPLFNLPNVRLDMSYKYSKAHMYAAPDPTWITTVDGNIPADLTKAGLKTWLEVRNEDFFMLHWGDPAFAKAYLLGFPDKDKYIQGFFYGSDGWVNTRVFASKDALFKGDLEIRRTWYTQMLWGRLSYNPNTPDAVFINKMAGKYPGISAATLFSAWGKASQGVPLFTEIVQGTWNLDYHWWPEACHSSSGFKTIDEMAGVQPTNGSTMCSIANTAAGKCGANGRTGYKVADEIQTASQGALDLISGSGAASGSELRIDLDNIKALAWLGLYYAEKLRGAAYKAAGQTVTARDAMGKADCDWKNYAALMDAMYTGMKMQRVNDLANWHAQDAAVTAEFTKLGGSASHVCQIVSGVAANIAAEKPMGLYSLAPGSLSFYLPQAGGYSVRIYSAGGSKRYDLTVVHAAKGPQRLGLDAALQPGVYLVQLASGGKSLVRRMQVLGG